MEVRGRWEGLREGGREVGGPEESESPSMKLSPWPIMCLSRNAVSGVTAENDRRRRDQFQTTTPITITTTFHITTS